MDALQQTWTFLGQWFNWPFVGALVACLTLSALQFIGLAGEHDADADLDADLDVDLDLDVDADLDLDVDTDLDLDADADVDADAGSSIGPGMALLEVLGVGHAPLTIVLMLLLAFFGLTGLALNSLLWNLLGSYPGLALVGVVPVALVVASLGTGRSSVFLGRLVPPLDTTATGMAQLVGRAGIVSSPQVDEKYGMVRVRDRGGTMITVFGITQPDAAPLARDSQVLLVRYDPDKRLFTVVPTLEPLTRVEEKHSI